MAQFGGKAIKVGPNPRYKPRIPSSLSINTKLPNMVRYFIRVCTCSLVFNTSRGVVTEAPSAPAQAPDIAFKTAGSRKPDKH